MIYIYALQLEQGKYYIGKTENPNVRMDDHFSSIGSAWTRKYKPLNVIEIIPNCDKFDEDKYTLKYMEKYGVMNVRGGSFCELKLSEESLNTITKMINGASDRCYICGEAGHFAIDCKHDSEHTFVDIMKKICESFSCFSDPTTSTICMRCGRDNHTDDKCYAKTTIHGFRLIDEIEHDHKYKQLITCYRCGRTNHTSNRCYARTDIDGNQL